MKIPLDRLTASPDAFRFESEPTWWRTFAHPQPGLPDDLPEALVFTLRAHRMGQDVLLEGEVEGGLDLECSRCLKRYRHGLREPFRMVLEPAGTRSPADPEGAANLARHGVCLGEELEAGWYRGEEIDLGGFFFELVSLALPVKPLCREDCPGLCPRCGADRSVSTCGCDETRSDSPFAVLAALKQGSTGGRN